jgi:hypothetical protein
MKLNKETPRQCRQYHRLRRGKRRVIALCALLLTCASAARAADVLYTRSMETRQIELSSYVLTCTLEFTGGNSNHTSLVNLFAQGTGLGITSPFGGEVGPDNPTFIIDEPGVTRFKATLKGHKLSIERLFYFEGSVPAGTTRTCQGGSRDRTTGLTLSEVQMTDLLRYIFSCAATTPRSARLCGRPGGFGFVEMPHGSEAHAAIAGLHGTS